MSNAKGRTRFHDFPYIFKEENKMKRIIFLLLFVLASSSTAVGADPVFSGRCGGKIIKPGLSKQFLLNHCREPDQVETFTRGSRDRNAVMERLIYYVGRFTYIVTVKEGTIESIKKEPR